MRARLISETLDEAGLGLKVRVESRVDRDALPDIGEAWARANADRADRVWVWLYGAGMDEDGPAIAVTYLESGRPAAFDFVPASTLMLYYLGAGGLAATPAAAPLQA